MVYFMDMSFAGGAPPELFAGEAVLKNALSISIGSSKRDKVVEIDLLGEHVRLERLGTDGDMAAAARKYNEMDGKVDAFGVGGTDLGLYVDRHWYPFYSVRSLTEGVRHTPVVDGTGLKTTLELRVARFIQQQLGAKVPLRRVFLMAGVDRWGMARSFLDAGCDCLFGDLMFGLGIPLPLRSPQTVKTFARLAMPIVGRIPFHWLYPVGEAQEKRTPRYPKQFDWADVIAGDCHYITRYMPDRLDGKVVVTNTTTPHDQEQFRQAGVKYLVTTTPVLDGRSFGTNMMEAAIVAALGRREPVDYRHSETYFHELEQAIDRMHLQSQVMEL